MCPGTAWFTTASVQEEEGERTVKASSTFAGVPAAEEVTGGICTPFQAKGEVIPISDC